MNRDPLHSSPPPRTSESLLPAPTPGEPTLEADLVELVGAYIGVLSGCRPCEDASVAAAVRLRRAPDRLRALPWWRRAPGGSFTQREVAALVWAETLALGDPKPRDGGGRSAALHTFTAEELDLLTQTIRAARGWPRVADFRAHGASPCSGNRAPPGGAACPARSACTSHLEHETVNA